MTADKPQEPQKKRRPTAPDPAIKEARLAEALRQNLRRRKAAKKPGQES